MYVKWTPKLRKYILRQVMLGITPISEIARNRKVPRRTIYYLLKRFRQGGLTALEPRIRGRKKEPVKNRQSETGGMMGGFQEESSLQAVLSMDRGF